MTKARNPDDEGSAYYPPRARWYSAFYYLGILLRRNTALDRLNLPPELHFGELVAGVFVPGLAVWFRGPKLWGYAAFAASFAAMLLFLLFLGHTPGNLAFGWMISLHVTGLVYYCNPLIANEGLRARLVFTIGALVVIGLVIYMPARNLIQDHWVVPINLNGKVVIVRRTSASHIETGDWVAYRLHSDRQGDAHERGGAVVIRAGVGLGPVLAGAGEHMTFSTNSFSVNGVLHTNLPNMPTSGEFTVPEKHWFIWPAFDMYGHGNVSSASINDAIMEMANVNESQLFGKPVQRWFGWKQTLP